MSGESWTGYRSLCAALCRAKELYHLPVHKPAFYGSVTMETMKRIFHSDSDMELPLLAERMSNLHEAGRVLNQVRGRGGGGEGEGRGETVIYTVHCKSVMLHTAPLGSLFNAHGTGVWVLVHRRLHTAVGSFQYFGSR